MKHLKLFIASLFLMLGMAVHAQQVEITKTDGTVEVFKPNEVDSVVYKPAPKYYYYAGWECPKTEEDLAKFAKGLNGEEIKNIETMPVGTQIRLFDGELTHERGNYYIVVPNNVGLFGPDGVNRIEDSYEKVESNIAGYNIYTSRGSRIEGCMLKKI